MSKTPSSKLFRLIKSLSSNEKRYFRMYFGGNQNKYISLFEAIDAQETYDDFKLRSIIYPDEEIKSRKFSELKAYLYDQILRALQAYDNAVSIDYKLKSMLKNVRVLYKRSHYNECNEYLNKAYKLSRKHEAYLSMLEILAWKKQIAYAKEDVDYLDGQLSKIIEEEENCLEKIENLSAFKNLFFKVLMTTKTNPLNRKEQLSKSLKEVIDNPLLSPEIFSISDQTNILAHRIYSLYYYNAIEFEKYYESSKRSIELMEANGHLLKEDISDYISALSNFTQSCGLLKKYDEVRACLEKFKKIKPITLDDSLKIHRHYYSMTFNLHIFTGDFNAGLRELENHLKASAEFKEEHFERSEFYSAYFKIYFGNEDYDKALDYLNKWLGLPKSIAREDLQSLSRTLDLLIHYEMGHTFLLESLKRRAYRFQKERDRLFEVERLIIVFINDSLKVISKKELRPLFEHLKAQLEKLKAVKSENIIFQYFDFISWVESKIKQKSFGEVVQQKAQNNYKLSNHN